MPLILAIEPDRRQASQLTAMVRERLRAELVLADSAERALAALGDRIPDLILTSALLSTKDETVLADRLRALDVAAAHVQTLTVPVLGTPRPRSTAGRGVFSALLGDRTSSPAAPDSCDPAMFADQCAAYLDRAAAERERQAIVGDAADEEIAPICEAIAPVHEKIATLREEIAPAPVHEEIAVTVDTRAVDDLILVAMPLHDERQPEVRETSLSALLDEEVVQQLSAAIETVAARRDSALMIPEPEEMPKAAKSRSQKTRAKPRQPARRPAEPAPSDLFDPQQCGFAALLAKLDEITHVASSLPADDPRAGPSDVSR